MSRPNRSRSAQDARLDELIETAIVDAHDISEQAVGFHTILEEQLKIPFSTEVLGVEVCVERIDVTNDDRIIAVCRRGNVRHRIAILDLPLSGLPAAGAEWIEAYRRWAGQGAR